MNYQTLYKTYKFEKVPSLDDWNVYSEEVPDIQKALDEYAQAYVKVVMSEIEAEWRYDGLTIQISEEDSSSIDISYRDCITALAESAHEYEYIFGVSTDQFMLDSKIEQLEEALKLLKSLKEANEAPNQEDQQRNE